MPTFRGRELASLLVRKWSTWSESGQQGRQTRELYFGVTDHSRGISPGISSVPLWRVASLS